MFIIKDYHTAEYLDKSKDDIEVPRVGDKIIGIKD